MDKTYFKQIFVISHIKRRLDQVWKLIWKWMWISLWDWVKFPDCKLSLKVYPQISNIILNNNLGLNLYIVSTIYYMVIISDNKVRS